MTDKHKTQQDGHSVGGFRRSGHTQLTSVLLAAVIYAVGYFLLIYYGVIVGAGSVSMQIGSWILFNAVFGLAIGRWWSLLLPITIVLMSIPYWNWTDSAFENSSTQFWQFLIFFIVPTAAALIACGVVIRWFIERPRE